MSQQGCSSSYFDLESPCMVFGEYVIALFLAFCLVRGMPRNQDLPDPERHPILFGLLTFVHNLAWIVFDTKMVLRLLRFIAPYLVMPMIFLTWSSIFIVPFYMLYVMYNQHVEMLEEIADENHPEEIQQRRIQAQADDEN